MHPAEPVKSRLLRCLSFRPEEGTRGRIRTCTVDALDVVSLLLDYASIEMAPTAGLAPAKTDLKDLSRDDFAFVGIAKWRNAEGMLLMPRNGGTISLATSPGSLVRLTFLVEWHSRKDFRLQPPRSKRSALYIELREHDEMVPMAGLAPALDRF